MTEDAQRSPVVRRSNWGSIEIEGLGRFRDVKLWPGGGRGWDWNETGTRHKPGIQPADLLELLAHEPDAVVLSRGRQTRLDTCPETLALLAERKIEVVQTETGAAIDRYNQLAAEGRRVAALLHTTC